LQSKGINISGAVVPIKGGTKFSFEGTTDFEQARQALEDSLVSQGYSAEEMFFTIDEENATIQVNFVNASVKAEALDLASSLDSELKGILTEEGELTGWEIDAGEITVKVSATGKYEIDFPDTFGTDEINNWLKENGFE
jgi:hypothetical protein